MSTIPRSLNQYELQQLLGRGSIGEVWKGFDTHLRRDVAVKVIHTDFQSDPNFLTRFTQEGQYLVSLQHIYLLPVREINIARSFQTNETSAYIIVDYVDGQSLAEYLKMTSHRGMFPSIAQVVYLFARLGSALDYLHQQGIAHGNIKPGNILFNRRDTSQFAVGDPLLSDAALVRLVNRNGAMNSPHYIAPEQAKGHQANPRSDIYALGVLLYEICTGVLPFRDESSIAIMMQHINTLPTPPSLINPNIPAALSEVILRAMAKETATRYPTASHLAAAIADACSVPPILQVENEDGGDEISPPSETQLSILGVPQPPPRRSGSLPKPVQPSMPGIVLQPGQPIMPPQPVQPAVAAEATPSVQRETNQPAGPEKAADATLPVRSPASLPYPISRPPFAASGKQEAIHPRTMTSTNKMATPDSPMSSSMTMPTNKIEVPGSRLPTPSRKLPSMPGMPSTPSRKIPSVPGGPLVSSRKIPSVPPTPPTVPMSSMKTVVSSPMPILPPPPPPERPPQSPMPPASSVPPRKRGVPLYIVVVVLLLLLLVTGSAVTSLILYNKGNTALNGGGGSGLTGQAYFQDDALGRNALLRIEMKNVPAPPSGMRYFAWLQTTTQQSLPLGSLEVKNGNISFLYPGDEQHTNLLSILQGVIVTQEATENEPAIPSDLIMYKAVFDEGIFQAIRELLYATPGLPQNQSVMVNLFETIKSINDKAGSIVDTLEGEGPRDYDLVKRQAARIIEMIEGTGYAQQTGDLPAQYQPQIGVKIGLLSSPEQQGYIDILAQQLEKIKQLAGNNTRVLKQVEHAQYAVADLQDWVQKMRDFDVQILKAADLADPAVIDIALQLKKAAADSYTGRTIPPNNGPQPLPGSAGAYQAYTAGQYMAALELQAV